MKTLIKATWRVNTKETNLHILVSRTQAQTYIFKGFRDNSAYQHERSGGLEEQQLLISHSNHRLSPQSLSLDH